MTQFMVVRHGETLWNRERRIQGQLDSPLTQEGERQAGATARRLRDCGGQRLVASDLGRTLQTALPISAAANLLLETDSRLRERCFGVFEGSTPNEIEARDAVAFARWQSRDPNYAMQAGESLSALCDRVRVCFESMARQNGGKVIVVTHGGVLDAVYRLASGVSLDAPRSWPLLNSSINEIEIVDGL